MSQLVKESECLLYAGRATDALRQKCMDTVRRGSPPELLRFETIAFKGATLKPNGTQGYGR